MRALLCALLVAMTAPLPAPAQMLDFASLEGWEADDHRAALISFLTTCEKLADDWQPLCRLAADSNATDASARAFFELFFRPVLIGAPPRAVYGLLRTRTARLRQPHPPLCLSDLRPPARVDRWSGLP